MTRDVLLGVVIGAQGLKGEVKVKTFTETPDKLGAYGPLHAKDGRALTIETLRTHKTDEAVVRFREIADRTAAETLKGTELFVSRDALPPPDADEFYHADLAGLRAEDTLGRAIGTVRSVHDFGAGTVIEIVRDDGDEVFLPFTHEVAREIDIKGGRIVIAEPEDIEAEKEGFVE
jgi:16S rRNA processing protein RimM